MSKKTTEIIINSKNHYIIAVKKNQKKLYEMLESKGETGETVSEYTSQDRSRGREITRTVEVFDDLSCINQNYWKGIQSFVRVTRSVKRNQKPYQERVYYICSLKLTAK